MTQSRTYSQDLYHDYRAKIASGEWLPGTQVPPIRELTKRSGKAQGTVVAALAALKADGFLETSRSRRGTFVSAVPPLAAADRVDLISLDGAMKINDYVRYQLIALENGTIDNGAARSFVEALTTTVDGLQQISATYDRYSQQAIEANDDDHAINMASNAVPFADFLARLRVVLDRASSLYEGTNKGPSLKSDTLSVT
jgi:DNA-binding transcriptional MocR family regulator